jgi:hypothetical protein
VDLARDFAHEPGIARAIHLAHAAFAKFGDDFIRTDARARQETQAQ